MTLDSGILLFNLRLVGVFLGALAVMNLFLPWYFGWREELSRVSLLTRQIFEVHSLFIILILALFSALLLTSADALLERTRLARAMLLGLTVFWGARLVMQWFYYSPAVWRGSRLHTAMHFVFSAAWIYVTAVFAATYFAAFS